MSSLHGFKVTYTGLVKTLAEKFQKEYLDLPEHYERICADTFNWQQFMAQNSSDLSSLSPIIVAKDTPKLLKSANHFLDRLHVVDIWLADGFTDKSKEYMWTYLRNLLMYSEKEDSKDIEKPPNAGGTGPGPNNDLMNGIQNMMKNIDPDVLETFGKSMMKGLTPNADGSPNAEPDLSGIANILKSVDMEAISKQILPAFQNSSEGDLSGLFSGLEQVMASLSKNEQFASLTEELTKTIEQKNQ